MKSLRLVSLAKPANNIGRKFRFIAVCAGFFFLFVSLVSVAQIKDRELLELKKMCRESVDARNKKEKDTHKSLWSFHTVYLILSTYSITEKRCLAIVQDFTEFSRTPRNEQRSTLLIDPISGEILARYDINLDVSESPVAKHSYRIQRGANLGKGYDGMTVVGKIEFESFVTEKTR